METCPFKEIISLAIRGVDNPSDFLCTLLNGYIEEANDETLGFMAYRLTDYPMAHDREVNVSRLIQAMWARVNKHESGKQHNNK